MQRTSGWILLFTIIFFELWLKLFFKMKMEWIWNHFWIFFKESLLDLFHFTLLVVCDHVSRVIAEFLSPTSTPPCLFSKEKLFLTSWFLLDRLLYLFLYFSTYAAIFELLNFEYLLLSFMVERDQYSVSICFFLTYLTIVWFQILKIILYTNSTL